jgi:deazaflavin-dependent oxidoreductase (nitroreductase family)
VTAALRWGIARALRLRFDPGHAQDLDATFELRVRDRRGRESGQFALRISGGACTVRSGPAQDPGAVATVALVDMIRLATRRAGWPELLSSGRLELSGDPFLALRFPALFRLPAGTGHRRAVVAALSPLLASPPVSWFMLNVANPVDRRLLPLTNGRLSLSIGQPILCLEVRGAKSGQLRRAPLLFAEVDGDLVVIASATGRPRHPAWYHNVRANPRVKVYAPGGRSGEYVARAVEGEARERLWAAAVDGYKGFEVYERRTTGVREIPVVALSRT